MSESKSGGKGPIVAFLIVLLLGIVAAGFVFAPKIKEMLAKQDEPIEMEETKDTPDSQDTSTSSANNMAANSGTGQGSAPGSQPYLTDKALLTDLQEKLNSGDLAGFVALAGNGLSDEDKLRLSQMIKDHGFKPAAGASVVELESTGDTKKWALKFSPPGELGAVGQQQIYLHFKRDPEKGWVVTSVEVPDVDALVAKMKSSSPSMDGKNANFAAQSFVEAVIGLDFQGAKNFVDNTKLTEEKLAALFIVVEQGAYKLRENKPLTAQVAKDDVAWMIANLISKDAKESQFGIEMERDNVEQPWKIVALNFDQMMQTVAMDAGAGGIAYAPYKPNPQGGESLVLYFEFDDGELNSRASKQLEVIANILKEDPSRQLHINGHADAIGDEEYNVKLSDSRAANVRGALLALGVGPEQVVTKAFGETAPKAPNFNPDGTDNTSGQAQNRRAEVHLKF